MRRTLILILLVTSTAVLLVATAAAAIAPIVSPKADPYYRYGGLKGTKGFGHVKPREIYYGGDPTGLVCKIHWHSWGGRVARGTGVGWYVSGNQSVAQGHATIADVKATTLGTWKGRPAYNRLTWSFPNHDATDPRPPVRSSQVIAVNRQAMSCRRRSPGRRRTRPVAEGRDRGSDGRQMRFRA